MIQLLTDGVTLYHGSYCEVRRPDLSRCSKYKDFGRGFYLTTSQRQAELFAKISTRKAMQNGLTGNTQTEGFVSCFSFQGLGRALRTRIFRDADADWLHCVVGHRRRGLFAESVSQLAQCDIVGGKIANDNTNATITAYMSGTFGNVGAESSDAICISLLLPERLENQYCFRSEKALQCLSFLKSFAVELA